MNEKQWLETLSQNLRRNGLPPEYVQRCKLEICDHLAEAAEHECGLSTFGEADMLTHEFVRSFRRGRWYRRIPRFVWLFLPFPLTILVSLVFYASAGVLLGEIVDSIRPTNPQDGYTLLVLWFFYLGKFSTPLCAAYLLLTAMKKAGQTALVRNSAVALLCVAFAMTYSELQLGSTIENSTLSLTLDPARISPQNLVIWQLIQASLVVVVTIRSQVKLQRSHLGFT